MPLNKKTKPNLHQGNERSNKSYNLKWEKYVQKKQEFPNQSSDISKWFTDNTVNNPHIFVWRSEWKYCL